MSTTAQEIPTTENKVYSKEKEVGDVVSLKWDHGTTIIQGIVKEINGNSLTIDTKSHGLVIAENNKEVYKFSPYQRIDLRELSMPLKEKTGFQDKDGNDTYKTVKSKLDSLLFSKTEYKTFDNWSKKNNGCLVTLLKGNLIHNNIKGESLLPQRDENRNIIANAPKRLVPWEAKFQVYRGKDGELKIDTIYKERQELSFKLFNKEVTPEEKEKLLKGESVAITRTRNAGGEFKLFARIDTDLNKIVTKPYSAKTEIVMQAAYARKATESITETVKKETTADGTLQNTSQTNTDLNQKSGRAERNGENKVQEKEAPKKAKSRRI